MQIFFYGLQLNYKTFFRAIMAITLQVIPEKNHSALVSIDATKYIDIFRKINDTTTPDQATEKQFKTLYKELTDETKSFTLDNLVLDLYDAILTQYNEDEQRQIKQSPAFNNLNSSCSELIKNTIDVFLQQLLADQSNENTHIFFQMHIELSDDKVSITFTDTGPGLRKEDLDEWKDEKNQLAYITKPRQSHKKSANIKGLCGGSGYGMNQLICQTLTNNTLDSKTSRAKPQDFDAKMSFRNASDNFGGAQIQITTQIEPYHQHLFDEKSTSDSLHSPTHLGTDSHDDANDEWILPSQRMTTPSPDTVTAIISPRIRKPKKDSVDEIVHDFQDLKNKVTSFLEQPKHEPHNPDTTGKTPSGH